VSPGQPSQTQGDEQGKTVGKIRTVPLTAVTRRTLQLPQTTAACISAARR
jgi:hypothetical protein